MRFDRLFHLLQRDAVEYLFEVSPYQIYELRAFLVSEETETVHNPCLMFFDFDAKELSPEALTANALSISPYVGYFRYIPVSPEGVHVHKKVFIPAGVTQVRIGFARWKSQSDIYLSKTVIFERESNHKILKYQNSIREEKRRSLPIKDIETLQKHCRESRGVIPSDLLSSMEIKHENRLPRLYWKLYEICMKHSPKRALQYAMRSLELEPQNEALRNSLFLFHVEHGSLKKAFGVLEDNSRLYLGSISREQWERRAERLPKTTIEKLVLILLERFPEEEERLTRLAFGILKDIHPEFAIVCGRRYHVHHPEDIKMARPLLKRMQKAGMKKEAYTLAKQTYLYHREEEIETYIFQFELEQQIGRCVRENGTVDETCMEAALEELKGRYAHRLPELYRVCASYYAERDHYSKAVAFMENALSLRYSEKWIRDLYDLHLRYGYIYKALSVIPKKSTLPALDIKKNTGGALKKLLEEGFVPHAENMSQEYAPQSNSIFYLLHNRLPYNSGGYATRTHGLLTNTAALGWNIQGVSRLGYPEDKDKHVQSVPKDTIDGITYYRLHNEEGAGLGKLPMDAYLQAYAEAVLQLALEKRPAIIHAASNHMNGLVANHVAKMLGIKSVYEVRGLWEITRISRDPQWEGTDYFKLMVKLETQAAKEADVVLTITKALKEEMVLRGVPAEKIHIIPNGVTTERFVPLPREKELAKKLQCQNKTVIGYIGSVVAYEGLELLVDAVAMLTERNMKDFIVLVVGDGAVLEMIQERVEEKNLSDCFIFTGRVPHEEVERYYSLVDIAPFPRKGQPVCEMVSPLKPFEAMAMEKAVLASNVAALAEIVQDGYNGLLFEKDNIGDLADKLERLIKDKQLRETLGKQARSWVKKERDWSVIAKRLDTVYKTLLKDQG